VRRIILSIIHYGATSAKSRHSCESRNPEKCQFPLPQASGRYGKTLGNKFYNTHVEKYNNDRGFTLLEIIITFILAAVVGSMLVEFMGTSLTRGGEAVVMVQDGFSLNSVMEKITADYEDEYKNGSYDFSTFKSNIEGGNLSNQSPYYGNYTAVTGYVSFPDGGGTETADTSGNNNLLKVTITYNNQSLTAIFRK